MVPIDIANPKLAFSKHFFLPLPVLRRNLALPRRLSCNPSSWSSSRQSRVALVWCHHRSSRRRGWRRVAGKAASPPWTYHLHTTASLWLASSAAGTLQKPNVFAVRDGYLFVGNLWLQEVQKNIYSQPVLLRTTHTPKRFRYMYMVLPQINHAKIFIVVHLSLLKPIAFCAGIVSKTTDYEGKPMGGQCFVFTIVERCIMDFGYAHISQDFHLITSQFMLQWLSPICFAFD